MKSNVIMPNHRKLVELFIRKATLVILNSRIRPKEEGDYQGKALNVSFLLSERDNEDVNDVFLEDYNELQLQSSYEEMAIRCYMIEIYFKGREFKALIEKWSLQYLRTNKQEVEMLDNDYCFEKLAVMLRSVYVLSRLMPAYQLLVRHSKEYSLEYRLFAKLSNQNRFENEKINKVEIANPSLLSLMVKLEYISLTDLVQLEKRFFSQNEVIRPIDQSHSKVYEIFTFDSGGTSKALVIRIENINKEKGNDPEHEEVIEDIVFEYHQEGTKTPNISVLQMENTSAQYPLPTGKSPHKINKPKAKTFNSKGESNEVKLMKTSDTSSSFISTNSFKLEIEDYSSPKSSPSQEHGNSAINDTTDVLYKISLLKSFLKQKKRPIGIDVYRLAEMYVTVLNSKY